MIDNLDSHLKSFAIGIRHGPNFVLADHFGKISDDILNSDKEYFNPQVFSRIIRDSNQVLLNDEANTYLKMTPNDIILNYGSGKPDDTKRVLLEFKELIIDSIMEEYKIRGIARIGYVYKYSFEDGIISNDLFDKATGTISGVDDLIVRFSKRLPAMGSLVQQDVNDYCNVIYTLVKGKRKQEILAMLDFQSYYSPALKHANMIPFEKFLEAANTYRQKHFIEWINSYAEKTDDKAHL